MLALSAGTTLVALLGLTGLSGLLDSSDDLEDEAQSDALEVAVVFCRVWLLASAVIGVSSVRGALQVSYLHCSLSLVMLVLSTMTDQFASFDPDSTTLLMLHNRTISHHFAYSHSIHSSTRLSALA